MFRIKEDTNGNLWICTGEGLTLYKQNTFYPANKAIGLYSGSVFNIEMDALGNAWVVTAKELLFVRLVHLIQGALENHPAEHLFRYNRLDGLAGELAANAWAYINKNNTLFVPTLRGVSVCDPTYYVKNKHVPPVVIENVVVDGRRFEATDKPFTLQAQTQRILFQFTALSFTIPQRVHFEYQLEGYETDWRSCGTTREIAYTNLPPGQYRFKVRAANNDGIINTEGTSVSFYKKPFFYQTLWFLLLVITTIAGLVLFAVNLRIRNLQLRAEELDRKVTEKTQELEQEKEKSDKLLRNTLPTSVIDELIKTGTSAPRMYPAVTVLFADLASFTEWSSNKSPADVIADLNTIFTQFDYIMGSFACERIKTLGDGYLACCGLRGEADHAERLTAAAIEMLRSLNDLNKKMDHAFKIKIGIDSGPITGGIVGVHKYIFDIFGDTVNTAFRLQAATVPMACTVSEKTADLIRGTYRLVKRPPRALKGKGTVSGYYVYYTADTVPPPFSRIKAEYDIVMRYFHSGQYKKCLAAIKALDATVLEPEMVYNISIVAKRCMIALSPQRE